MLNVLVGDIMCTTPIKVGENVSVGDVNHLLLRYRINGILVVSDKDKNDLIGIFTTTDSLRLMEEAFSKGKNKMKALKELGNKPVGKYAKKKVIVLHPEMKITKAIAIMHRKNVHTLPVFENDCMVGVIGRHDLMNVGFA